MMMMKKEEDADANFHTTLPSMSSSMNAELQESDFSLGSFSFTSKNSVPAGGPVLRFFMAVKTEERTRRDRAGIAHFCALLDTVTI